MHQLAERKKHQKKIGEKNMQHQHEGMTGKCRGIRQRRLEYDQAVNIMSSSYELISQNYENVTDDVLKQEYRNFFKAYSYALDKIGKTDLSKKISEDWKL